MLTWFISITGLWNRFTPRGKWMVATILIVLSVLLLSGLFLLFGSGSDATINQSEIDELNRRTAEHERQNIAIEQEASRQRVDEMKNEVKEAENNTANVKANRSRGINGKDLDRLAREQ